MREIRKNVYFRKVYGFLKFPLQLQQLDGIRAKKSLQYFNLNTNI